MIQLCDIPGSACAPCDFPLLNLTSENEDKEIFIGIAFEPNPPEPPTTPPKLGSRWTSIGCVSVCESTVSQEDADRCATNQNASCALTPPPTITCNFAQTATVTCPDGSPFSYTVPAGTFCGTDQISLNLQAFMLASKNANKFKLCLGSITPTACALASYSSRLQLTPAIPAFWQIIDGSLPPGLTFHGGQVSGGSVLIDGTPTTVGTYNFTIRASTQIGTFIQKPFQIMVQNCGLLLQSNKSSWAMGDTVILTATLAIPVAGHVIQFSWAAPGVPTGAALVGALTNASGIATLTTKRIGYGGSGGLYPFPRLYTGPVQLTAVDVTASPNITSNVVMDVITTPADVHCTDIANYINMTVPGHGYTGDLIPYYSGDPALGPNLDWVDSSAISTYSGSGQPAIQLSLGNLNINYAYFGLGGPPQLAYQLLAGNINAPQGVYTLVLGGGPPGSPPPTVTVT